MTQVGLVLESDILKHVLSIDVDPTVAVHLLRWLQLSLGYGKKREGLGDVPLNPTPHPIPQRSADLTPESHATTWNTS